MVLPLKYTCFVCVPLEVGVTLIAWLHLIVSGIALVVMSGAGLFFTIASLGLVNHDFDDFHMPNIVKMGVGILLVILMIMIIIVAFDARISYRLLKATEERRPGPVLTWAVLHSVYSFLFICFVIEHPINADVVICAVVQFYFLLVVYSYYYEIKQPTGAYYLRTANDAQDPIVGLPPSYIQQQPIVIVPQPDQQIYPQQQQQQPPLYPPFKSNLM